MAKKLKYTVEGEITYVTKGDVEIGEIELVVANYPNSNPEIYRFRSVTGYIGDSLCLKELKVWIRTRLNSGYFEINA